MAEIGSVTAAAAGVIGVGGDITVNRLGFGAIRITGPGIIGDPPDRERAQAVLRRVVELGVNFIDTADSYGPHVSENLIAETLYPYPDDVVVATKGGLERPGPDQWAANGRPEHLREACEGSLRRLRLDEIPLYQLHRPDPEVPFVESVGALADLKDEGKIRHVGLCNVTEDQVQTALWITPIASVQNRYNAGDRRSDLPVDLCELENMVFLPWAPLKNLDEVPVVADIANERGATPSQVALAWLLKRSPAMLPIPGTGSVEHLEENVAAARLDLSREEVAAITDARPG